MRFAGVDLAWGRRSGTGLCVVESGQALSSTRLVDDESLLTWLGPHIGGACLVAFDAPLIVTNPSGRRPCERKISRCFGSAQASAHSSNLGMPSFRDGGRAARLARSLKLSVDPVFTPQMAISRAIEVYPHPATVALFDLPFTLKYKARRGRTLDTRRAAFRELVRLVETLDQADPPLDVTSSPRWAHLAGGVEVAGASELDRLEDELDAYLCAYIALYYWTHGLSRCRVVGDTADGYIVTPVTPQQASCLDAVSADGPSRRAPARRR
jgi:predicted RNase H-like nuclease